MNTLAARRRHPAAALVVVLLALLATGAIYAVIDARTGSIELQAARKLRISACSNSKRLPRLSASSP